jgi:hypothetical protein
MSNSEVRVDELTYTEPVFKQPLKFFYFVAVLGDVIFSFNKGRIWFFFLLQFYTANCIYNLYFRDIIISLTNELYAWVLTECQRFLQFLTSLQDESSVLSKRCAVYFTGSDDGNSSKSRQ